MRKTKLEPGCTEIGIIKDHSDSSHSIVGMLSASEEASPVIRMPYLTAGFFGPSPGAGQFKRIAEWFSSEVFPSHLSFDAGDLRVQLFGCRFSSRRESMDGESTSTAIMTPEVTVVSSENNQSQEPLLFQELSSSVDGLLQWSALRAVSYKPDQQEDGLVRSFSITATTMDAITWRAGAAELSLDIRWLGRPDVTFSSATLPTTSQAMIETSTWLTTAFDEPQLIEVHLEKQRDLVALLLLVYGAPIRFRQHRTSDDRFGAQSHVVYARTWRQHHEELKRPNGYQEPVFRLKDIGVAGLERWYSKDKRWRRAVSPLYGLLQRDSYVVEDVAIAALISLEASGQLIEEPIVPPTKLPPLATHVYQCLSHINLDWEKMPFDQIRLSLALARNYNDVKHFDRGDFPEPEVTHALGSFALYVARYVILSVASERIVENHLKSSSSQGFLRSKDRLKHLNIDDKGIATWRD